MYDFIVIGGGIVGLATARNLLQSYPRAKLLILDKESQWAFHQTSNNSGVIHSGIYYKPGSFKAKFCREGNISMTEFCNKYNISHEICGKVIVATKPQELSLLEDLYQRGLANGLKVEKISAEEVKEVEPHVSCIAGLRVFSTGIVSYRQVCQKLVDMIRDDGGELLLKAHVTQIKDISEGKEIDTSQGIFATRMLINCGGLQSDHLAKLGNVDPQIQIIPFRGEYYELKPEKRYLVKTLIYPVPNPNFPFLGVHFTKMIDGSVHAGPNAVLSLKREGYHKTDFDMRDAAEIFSYPGFWKLASKYSKDGIQEIIRSFSKDAFVRSLQQLIPEVISDDLVPTHAGVRAQALKPNGQLVEDFLIIKDQKSIHVCNAPSPAATSSLEIGKAIVRELST
ncbi:L-2-hydroxyglutarate oxidase [Pseudanabaena galeata UHCC 0370]|jgi:(S)-2-hydroxyglutarate dehydrogenase|uniref:L-2-hydroxyglutarate oxidase n=1 Tax=Pseudanabaena galeata UHCC 0370 TaxID=3110310 RepID=A0ABU5TDA0_9CYAN|nr:MULTISPECIES: L-2-hydroxyglutarate oxidase [Pseudanabaena]MEA5476240.1 L-2-hydroxyglutarate oxidase [Pseudanabaena galeata UHCC 0370]MEA5488469.1 L-2-hydroxyglutarate oxidase [Pseudanabaena sp. CCNP1317]WGS74271.1 L-2-hydroxyglutarate oxidase [Pseudanabaena galeata CCNP1313]